MKVSYHLKSGSGGRLRSLLFSQPSKPKKKARKPEKEQEAAASSAVKPGKGSKARKGKGKGKQEDADGEEQIPEEEVEEDEENPRKGKGKGKGKVRGNDRVAACFARRRCPDGGAPKAKWLSLRSAFEKIVKIHLKTYSSHEAFQLKFKIRVKKKTVLIKHNASLNSSFPSLYEHVSI